MGFLWLWVLVSLQRPVQWTMAAVIAHVMIQWQESAAAVLLASLCSRTARPAKVKHHRSDRTCPAVTKLIFHLSCCQAHRSFFLHLELTGMIIKPIYAFPTLPVSTFSNLLVGFSLYRLHYHCFAPTSALTMSTSLLVPPILHYFLLFSRIFWVIFCHATSFLDSFSTTLPSSSFLSVGGASSTQATCVL